MPIRLFENYPAFDSTAERPASGLILFSNGSQAWAASTLASAGIVAGSGTTDEIAFWSGANTLSSSPRITRASSGNLLSVTSGAAGDTALTVTAHASQSANLLNVKDSSGNAINEITSAGVFRANIGMVATRYSGTAQYVMRHAAGTISAPTQSLSGTNIGFVDFQAYTGSAFANVAQIRSFLLENFTTSTRESYLTLAFYDNAGNAQPYFYFERDRNFGIRVAPSQFGTATDTIGITNATTAPSAGITDVSQVYSADLAAGQAALHVRSEDNYVTKLGAWASLPGGLILATTTKAIDYTLTKMDYRVGATASGITLTLPTAASVTGQTYQLHNFSTGTVTIATTSSQTIGNKASGNPTSVTLASEEYLKVYSDGSNWRIE
jgi:hypothetical protein